MELDALKLCNNVPQYKCYKLVSMYKVGSMPTICKFVTFQNVGYTSVIICVNVACDVEIPRREIMS